MLARVSRRSLPVLIAEVTALLEKVRGEPARHLVDLLEQHEVVTRAVASMGSRSSVGRVRAVHLLGLTRDDAHLDTLAGALSDRSREVRGAAVAALRALGDARAAAPVLQAVRSVRGHAGLPSSAAIEALLTMGIGIAPALREGLDDPDPGVRYVAVVVAGHGLFGSTLPQLRDLLESDQDVLVRSAAATALGRAGLSRDLPALTQATASEESAELRRAAATALGELGVEEATATLTGHLLDTDRRLAGLAGEALVRLGAVGIEALEAAEARGESAALGPLDQHRLRAVSEARP